LNNGEFYLADAIEVIDEILAGGGEFRMYPKGVSMLPLIRQGRDSVVLRRNFEEGARKHDIAFYRRTNGQFVLHRVMKISSDGSFVMCGDNQTVLETGIRREQIIGYVSKLYRDDKECSFRSLKYRIYKLFWCCMPYRRAERYARRIWGAVKRRVLRIVKKNNT